MSGTIRSRTEARKAAHSQDNVTKFSGETRWLDHCRDCRKLWPCPDRVAADDTLTDWKRLMLLLAEAERGISFNGDSKSILQQILAANADPDSRGAT